jgi:DNA repair exonuclease SbcCD ATPase subunit
MEDLAKKVKELEKEIARLTKANKTLRNRSKKLEEENVALAEELDEKDAMNAALREKKEDTCPLCGAELMLIRFPDGKGVEKCSRLPACKHTRKLK